jgi:hypothetical protein
VKILVNLPQQIRSRIKEVTTFQGLYKVVIDKYDHQIEPQFKTTLPYSLKYMFSIRITEHPSLAKHKQKFLSGKEILFDFV